MDVLDRSALGSDDPAEVAEYVRQLVSGAFLTETAVRQQHRDPTRLTLSGLGGCTRAAAYRVARTWPSDSHPGEEARQALLGTWLHEKLLPAMAKVAGPGAVVEYAVKLRAGGLTLRGTLDLATDRLVLDLKSVREWRLHGVRRDDAPYDEHYLQVFGYALARFQAGHPVRWVVFLYMDRSTGEVHILAERFTNRAALAVVDRLTVIRRHADDPDRAPRDGYGPGLSMACDRCPWLRRCWGPDAVPGQTGAQKSIAVNDPAVEAALELYAAAAATAGRAGRDKEFAKLVLAGTPDGRYGRWRLRRGRPGSMVDHDRVEADFAARGLELPRRSTVGAISVVAAGEEG